MGIIFFVVVTPIGIIMRLLKKDLLNLKIFGVSNLKITTILSILSFSIGLIIIMKKIARLSKKEGIYSNKDLNILFAVSIILFLSMNFSKSFNI